MNHFQKALIKLLAYSLWILGTTSLQATPPASVIKPSGYSQSELDTALLNFYQDWKTTYLVQQCGEGRYLVDMAADGNTVEGGTAASTLTTSEAHGYGMLITVMMADFDPQARRIFDGMVDFFHDHPAQSAPGLIAWNQLRDCKDAGENVGGRNSASDGDMDIAYAFLLADKKWGSSGKINYKHEAINVITAIKQHEVDPENHFIRLGDWVDDIDDGQYANTTRSSDFMVSHLKAYADATGDKSWNKVRDTTYAIMASIRQTDSPKTALMPDFIVDLPHHPQPAKAMFLEGEDDGAYSWNAARYPWRVALDYRLYGDKRALSALAPINQWIINITHGDPKRIADTYALDGTYSKDSGFDSMAFVSMFAVSATIDPSNQAWLNALWENIKNKPVENEDYFGNTLKMLAMITITGHWDKPLHL
ncbi:MAG: licheninase [Oceanospirillaceae bacterium]|nr:licheninase [Oceanospirillaceae bacterium]